jgi:hypothetical protein
MSGGSKVFLKWSSRRPQPFVVTNTGGTNLIIFAVTIKGTFALEFRIISNTCTGSTLTPFFEEVLVLNSFDISAPILVAGVTVCALTLTLTGAARADLWVPPGTTVNCDIMSLSNQLGYCQSSCLLTAPCRSWPDGFWRHAPAGSQ